MTLPPYPEYKPSGIDWLGDIPSHWGMIPLRAITRVKNERNHPDLPLLSVYREYGVILRDSRDDNYNPKGSKPETYKVVHPGDLVLNKMKTWQGSLGVSQHEGIVSPAYIVCELSGDVHDRYVHSLLRSKPYVGHYNRISFGVRVNQWDMRYEDFKQTPVLLPPPDEQTAIVRFLDAAETRIRRYIRAKQKLIKLLNEQKQAIIQQAVTRGLDPDAPMKNSGVEWLGEIPAHWETIALGVATNSIQTGPFGSQLHASDYVIEGVPVINPSHLRDGRIVPDTQITVTEATAMRLSRHTLKVGDIVAARRGELGRCALVTPTEQGWLCGTGSLIIRVRQDIFEPSYLVQLISSQGVKDSLSLESVGATMDNLNEGMVSRLRLPCPDLMVLPHFM
jgi:type I restriction enzyme, S subunit